MIDYEYTLNAFLVVVLAIFVTTNIDFSFDYKKSKEPGRSGQQIKIGVKYKK
jgi:hypothetical protein